MREIKFRAWDGNPKRMIHEPNAIKDNELINDIFKDNSVVWMQYTGLKDKNGVEIYEGDIVCNSISCARVEVRWQSQVNTVHWGTEVVKKEVTGWIPFCTGWANYLDSSGFEVIGNVHENRELLDAKRN